MAMELYVKKLLEKEVRTADSPLGATVYEMQLATKGISHPTVKIVQEEPFEGVYPGDVLTISFKRAQKTLDESIEAKVTKKNEANVRAAKNKK